MRGPSVGPRLGLDDRLGADLERAEAERAGREGGGRLPLLPRGVFPRGVEAVALDVDFGAGRLDGRDEALPAIAGGLPLLESVFVPILGVGCHQFLEARLDAGFLIEISISRLLCNLQLFDRCRKIAA